MPTSRSRSGVYEEHITVLSKIVCYLFQDGCVYIYISTYIHTAWIWETRTLLNKHPSNNAPMIFWKPSRSQSRPLRRISVQPICKGPPTWVAVKELDSSYHKMYMNIWFLVRQRLEGGPWRLSCRCPSTPKADVSPGAQEQLNLGNSCLSRDSKDHNSTRILKSHTGIPLVLGIEK